MRRVSKEEALADMRARGFQRTETGCVMCDLARRSDRAEVNALCVRDDEHAVVVVDRYASTRGDLLVIVRRHVERTVELSLAMYLEVQRLVFEANLALEKVFTPERIYIATFGAPSATASTPPAMSFPHFHVHVLPIYDVGEAARPAAIFSWTSNVSLYDEGEAEQIAADLRAAWPLSDPRA